MASLQTRNVNASNRHDVYCFSIDFCWEFRLIKGQLC